MTGHPNPHALLFDWDNTLVDTWAVIHAALVPTFTAMGHRPWTIEECKQRVRQSARDAFPRLFGARADEALEIFYDAYGKAHVTALSALPGASELLSTLSSEGYHLGIVSNKAGELLRPEVAAMGWQRYFSAVIGASDAPKDKPAPEAPAMALGAMGVEASEEVWFVGDTDIDMHCAVEIGCLPVLLRDEPPREGEFANCQPRIHVNSCPALLGLIFGKEALTS